MEFTVDNVFKLLKKSLTIIFLQDTMDNRVPLVRCVGRGLFFDNMDVYQLLATPMFKKILLTDATTEDGEDEVTKYFKFRKNGIAYWVSGTQIKEPSLVMNGTMSYYFL